MQFQDKELRCSECGETFVFTAGEQEFFAAKGFVNEPKRCPSCRRQRRGQQYQGQRDGSSGYPSRQMYSVVCAECGAPTEVPFLPRQDRPVYCNDCYSRRRLTGQPGDVRP